MKNCRAILAAVISFASTSALAQACDTGAATTAASASGLPPAAPFHQSAGETYAKVIQEAAANGSLAARDHPDFVRLQSMLSRFSPFFRRWNREAVHWQWEIGLLTSRLRNLSGMPGGKLIVHTGLIESLRLSEDELAMAFGHAVASILLEQARARVARQTRNQMPEAALQALGLAGLGPVLPLVPDPAARQDVLAADKVGMEIAACAGYDPRAVITLWEKMQAVDKNPPPMWLSSHPAPAERMASFKSNLPLALSYYESARQAESR